MKKSEWKIEAGFDTDNQQKSVIEYYHFTGTPQQLEKHMLNKYKKGAEYVTVELYKD
jgi:hypothetical protein